MSKLDDLVGFIPKDWPMPLGFWDYYQQLKNEPDPIKEVYEKYHGSAMQKWRQTEKENDLWDAVKKCVERKWKEGCGS